MTPEEATQLASRLRRAREQKGLSAAEVARRAGITTGTVTRIELGQIAAPRAESLLAIAAVLDIPASDIFIVMNWLPSDQLPSFSPYLRSRYQSLPEEALAEIQGVFDRIAEQYGLYGPGPKQDEYI